jgi:hypothetical protein
MPDLFSFIVTILIIHLSAQRLTETETFPSDRRLFLIWYAEKDKTLPLGPFIIAAANETLQANANLWDRFGCGAATTVVSLKGGKTKVRPFRHCVPSE